MEYVKNPMEIEKRSMDIIEMQIKGLSFTEKEKLVVKRMIHTTGDFDYKNIISFKNDFIDEAIRSLKKGSKIFTDTRMASAGINKKALSKTNCSLHTYIDDDRAVLLSKEKGTTRSSAAVDIAIDEGCSGFVIGNAPTALFRLCEHMDDGFKPSFVIGVPVGFVGAAASKETLRKYEIPSISTIGTKGGSNVAASIINALLYMSYGR